MASEFYAKLTFAAGNAPNYWCVDLRKPGQRATVATVGYYPQPHMAVDAANAIWRETVHMERHERDMCEMAWQIEGAQMYAESLPVEACDNPSREHGWRLAFGDDVQPVGITQ